MYIYIYILPLHRLRVDWASVLASAQGFACRQVQCTIHLTPSLAASPLKLPRRHSVRFT